MLSDEDIEMIRNTKLSDIIKKVTTIGDEHIQNDVFNFKDGDPCPQPFQLNASQLENCPYLRGYDYFEVHRADLKFLFTLLVIFRELAKYFTPWGFRNFWQPCTHGKCDVKNV
jgi:dual oxidase